MAKRVNYQNLKPGDRLFELNYYKVLGVNDTGNPLDTVSLEDQAGAVINVTRGIVEDVMFCTSQYNKEEKVTKRRLAQILEAAGHASFRVTFLKQVASNSVADGLDGSDLSTQAKRRKLVKTLMEGETRVMHARLHRSEEDDVQMELGRFRVVDLEIPKGEHNERLVDTRTVSELILEGVRYHV